jgi:hypothetical protein
MTNSSKEKSKEEMMKLFIGKRVCITHRNSIFLTTEGICQDIYPNPPGQDDSFEIRLDSGIFFGVISDTFGDNFVEGGIPKARGRRRVEIME